MASWTDTNIPKFNPYVQQLPVEAMVQVGMHKQQQYEQGIEKIQTNIDNIAGLDVMRDIDKTYLQSKLNELGNNLKTVAAGDFSNFQLVNSVNGMTTQITKDKNVQTAVGSTAWYRKQAAQMEKAITEGKASQANIYDFNNKAGQWINSDKLDEGFNGRYTQYTDVKKKALEAIKGLHPKLQQYDVPFEVDGNGNINTKKIADAMIRHKIEGIDENQIQQAVYANMSPDDLNQLRIDANYQFRGIDSEQLIQVAQKDYDTGLKDAVSSLETLKSLRAITTDPNKLNQIDERISSYEDALGKDGQIGTLAEQLNKNIEQAISSPDEVKYSLYKNGFIKEFGNAFSWKNETKEYLKNPLKEQENFVADMRFKQQVENRHRYEFGVNVGLKKEEIRLKAEENAMKHAELYGVDAPWTPLGNLTDNTLLATQHFGDHVDSVASTIEGANKQLLDANYSQGEINAMLINFEKNQGVADIPAEAIGVLQTLSKNKNYLKTLETFQTDLKAKSEKNAGVLEITNKSLQGKSGIAVTANTGEKVTLTPKELLEIVSRETTKVQPATPLGIKGQSNTKGTVIKTVDVTGLNKNQKKYVDLVYNNPQKLNHQTYTKINSIANSFKPAANAVKNAYEKADQLYQTELGKRANAFVPQIKAVAGPKGELPPTVLPGLEALLIAAQEKGIAANRDFNFSTASDYLTEKQVKDTRVFVKQNGDNYEIQIRNKSDNATPQVLTVSGSQVAAYLGAKYINANAQASARISLGMGSSDVRDKNIAQEAQFQKSFGDFPNIRKLKMTANLKQDISNPDAYIPTIYLQNTNGKYTSFELSGDDKLSRVDYDSAKLNLSKLDDNTVLKVLKQNYPNFDFSTIQQ
jgi:hypothetical protein